LNEMSQLTGADMTYEDRNLGAYSNAEPDTSIVAGHRVRSYDFPEDRDDSYVEGVVEEITERIEGCSRYRIRVERRVRNGVECEVGNATVIPPVNGTPTTFGRITNGVVRIA
jgi:hypothetical protein